VDLNVLFAVSAAVLVWTWIGYPLCAWALARLFRKPLAAGEAPGAATVVIVARDEEPHIGDKLRSLRWAGPLDLEVIVVDDGSRDGTARVAREHGAHVIQLRRPKGKAAALNAGVARASYDVVVLTDARQPLAPRAIEKLVAPFADPTVGAVSGELEGLSGAAGAYRRFDDALRRLEAERASTIGVTGALWAIRRGLFPRLPERLILDDVYAPMYVVAAGFRVVVAREARVIERAAANTPEKESERRVRTLAGNLQLVRMAPWLIAPVTNPLWWRFWSHKLFRLFGPLAIAGASIAILELAPRGGIWAAFAAAESVGLTLALLGAHAGRAGALARAFLEVQVHCLRAWGWAIAGGRAELWRGRATEPAGDSLPSAEVSHGLG
jgi:poly-beta-1,6-N-acetyl-D-glucosamine synthase